MSFPALFWIFSAVSIIPIEVNSNVVTGETLGKKKKKKKGKEVMLSSKRLFCTCIKKFCSYQSLNQRQL